MSDTHKISNQTRTDSTISSDLFVLSRSVNSPYDTMWKSYAANAKTISHSFAEMIKANEYKEQFNALTEMYNSYLNNSNLSLCCSKDSSVNKCCIALKSEYDDQQFGQISIDTYSVGYGLAISGSNEIYLTADIKKDAVAYKPTQFFKMAQFDLFLDNEKPIKHMDSLMTDTYDFSSLSTYDSYQPGIYTWELFCKSSQTIGAIKGFGEYVKYVGTNLSNDLIVDTPIKANSTAVFAVRLIRQQNQHDIWNVNYCYQF